MGAEFNFTKADLATGEQVEDAYARERRELSEDFVEQHGPDEEMIYTGTMLDDDGTLEVHPERIFADEEEARAWVTEHAEKWGPTLAVPVGSEGNITWYWGGWYAD